MSNSVLKLAAVVILVVVRHSVADEEEESKCPHTVAQEDVNLNKISGNWTQLYISEGSIYQSIHCTKLEVFPTVSVNNTIRMIYHYEVKESPELHYEVKLDLNAEEAYSGGNEAEGESSREFHFIGNHVASDYDTYLILHTCDEETGIESLDVQVRAGKRRLGRVKRKEINKILRRIANVDLKGMKRVTLKNCPNDIF